MFSPGQWWCPRHIVPRLCSRLILHCCHGTIASSSDVRTPCEIKIIALSNVCHNQNSHNGRPTVVYLAVLFSTVWHLDNPTIELFNLISYDVYTFEDEATTSKHVGSARYSLRNVSRGISRFSKQWPFFILFLSTGRNVVQVSKSIHHISVHLTIQYFSRSKKLIPLTGSLTILSMFSLYSRP